MLGLTTKGAWLFLANALLPLACLVFARGFFPYKPFLSGLAEYTHLEYGDPPAAHFDKLIFMVVDALRRHATFAVIRQTCAYCSLVTLCMLTIQDSNSLRGT